MLTFIKSEEKKDKCPFSTDVNPSEGRPCHVIKSFTYKIYTKMSLREFNFGLLRHHYGIQWRALRPTMNDFFVVVILGAPEIPAGKVKV